MAYIYRWKDQSRPNHLIRYPLWVLGLLVIKYLSTKAF